MGFRTSRLANEFNQNEAISYSMAEDTNSAVNYEQSKHSKHRKFHSNATGFCKFSNITDFGIVL